MKIPFFPVVHVFKYICICNLISMYETGMDPGKAGCVCGGGGGGYIKIGEKRTCISFYYLRIDTGDSRRPW